MTLRLGRWVVTFRRHTEIDQVPAGRLSLLPLLCFVILRLAASLLLGRYDGGRLVFGPRDVDDLTVEQLGILLGQQRQEAFNLFTYLFLARAGGILLDPEFTVAKIIIFLSLRL